VTGHRLRAVLAGVGLILSGLSGAASAHPWNALPDAPAVTADAGAPAAVPSPDRIPLDLAPGSAPLPDPPKHPGPPTVALVAGALVLAAGMARRRRSLALALALLLGLVAFEGVFHAALHWRHLPHADNLVIGAAITPQVLADADVEETAPPPLAFVGEAIVRPDAAISHTLVASKPGRAPPFRAA